MRWFLVLAACAWFCVSVSGMNHKYQKQLDSEEPQSSSSLQDKAKRTWSALKGAAMIGKGRGDTPNSSSSACLQPPTIEDQNTATVHDVILDKNGHTVTVTYSLGREATVGPGSAKFSFRLSELVNAEGSLFPDKEKSDVAYKGFVQAMATGQVSSSLNENSAALGAYIALGVEAQMKISSKEVEGVEASVEAKVGANADVEIIMDPTKFSIGGGAEAVAEIRGRVGLRWFVLRGSLSLGAGAKARVKTSGGEVAAGASVTIGLGVGAEATLCYQQIGEDLVGVANTAANTFYYPHGREKMLGILRGDEKTKGLMDEHYKEYEKGGKWF